MKRLNKFRDPAVMNLLTILLVVSISLAGMWLLKKSTPLGLGLNTDSVYYVNGARNILAGHGFYRTSGEGVLKPITHFPPLFSIVLSGVGLSGLDPMRGGRLVIILLYGLNACLFAWLTYLLTRSRILALGAAALMTFSSVNLREFSILMSEPLYLCLGLINLITAWYYLQKHRTWQILLLGISAGLMDMTRYIGLSVLVAWSVFIVLTEKTWRERLSRAGLFLLVSLPFVVGVMARNYLLTGSTGNRNLIFHPIPFEKIASGIQAFWAWFLPPGLENFFQSLKYPFIGLFFFLLLVSLIWIVRQAYRLIRNQSISLLEQMLLLLGLICIIYLGMVFITINLFDATTVYDDRMLLPVYQAVVSILLVAIGWFWRKGGWIRQALILSGAVAILSFAIIGSANTVSHLSLDGQGFLNSYWRKSPTMQYIRDHDIGLFYTNQPPTVYALTGKAGYMVPSPVDSLTLQARQSYQQDLALMKEKINKQDGLLIFFLEKGYETDPWYLDLTSGLEAIENTPDAILWGRVE